LAGEEQTPDRSRLILTPDQRVRVSISSRLEELAEERAAALRAIRRLLTDDLAVLQSERFGADDQH
jgi:hypothetical protein